MPSAPFNISSKVVRAGAGAGKTYSLVERVILVALEFKKQQGDWPRIIVTTFTRKATQELRERLIKKCLEGDKELLSFVQNPQLLKISTIHGLFDSFLRAYGAQLNFSQDFQVWEPDQAFQEKKRILTQILVAEPEMAKILKDQDMFSLLSSLDNLQDFDLQSSKPLTFANQESLALQRISKYHTLWESLEEEIISSANEKWLEYAKQINLLFSRLKSKELTTGSKELEAEIKLVKRPRKNSKNPLFSEEFHEAGKAMHKEMKAWVEDAFSAEYWLLLEERLQLFNSVALLYQKKLEDNKKRKSWLELTDLEQKTQQLARLSETACEHFASKWSYWLIDEYQDTSPLQEEVLSKLIGESPFYIVGDPQQSIYLFRGADNTLFTSKQKEAEAKGFDIETLSKNYRSSPQVLCFINTAFKSMSDGFNPMQANKDLKPVVPINMGVLNDSESEEAWVLQKLSLLKSKATKEESFCFLLRTNEQVLRWRKTLSDAGFICHAKLAHGFYSAREVKDLLIILKFLTCPWSKENTINFLRLPYLTIDDQKIYDWTSGLEEQKLWQVLKDKCANDELGKVGEFILTALRETVSHGICEALENFLINIKFFSGTKYWKDYGKRESNIWKMLLMFREYMAKPGANVINFVDRFLDQTKVIAEPENPSDLGETGGISLMTVHGSKGLEFDYLFLPELGKRPLLTNMEDFCFDAESKVWSMRTWNFERSKKTGCLLENKMVSESRGKERLENQRLFYVAMTRAVSSLVMSWQSKPSLGSWADLLSLPLNAGEHKMEVGSYLVETEALDQVVQYVEPQVDLLNKSKPYDAKVKLQKHMSVTELVGKDASTENTVTKSSKPSLHKHLKILQGVKAHKVFELLSTPYKEGIASILQSWFPGDEEKMQVAIEYLLNLDEPPIKSLIETGFAECPISFKKGDVIVDGQIDLWGIVEGKIWIIDYKTGSTEYAAKGRGQLELYGSAILKKYQQFKASDVHLSLVFPFESKVMTHQLAES